MRSLAVRFSVVFFVFIAVLSGRGAQARADVSGQAVRSADRIASSWTPLETSQGLFPDYAQEGVPPTFRTPSLWLGYGLLASGVRSHDRRQIDAGLRAIEYGVTHKFRPIDYGAFDNAAVASAYNLARAEIPDVPLFAEHRKDWEAYLRHAKLLWLPNERHYANKYLVDAVAAIELLRTGLTSDVPGSALADRSHTQELVLRLVNEIVPAYGRRTSVSIDGRPAFILSDPSNNALAYQGLSLGFYARAVNLLGGAATPAAHDALERVARASWALTAPDGDLAYIGRSQEQAWALALTAYGAETAAQDASDGGGLYRGVAQRALARLDGAYGTNKYGFLITPALKSDLLSGVRGLDAYASAPSYSGLTLMGLEWTARAADGDSGPVGPIAADGPSAHVISPGRLQFAVSRAGNSWFAVKRASSYSAGDLRYDFGLVAMETRRADGTWVPVLPLRPHTTGREHTAGPVLRAAGGVGLPEGTRTRLGSDGRVTVEGAWRTLHGGVVRSGLRYSVAPSGCGVAIRFRVPGGAEVDYSVFLRDSSPISRKRGLLSDGVQVVRFPASARVKIVRGYSSDADPRVAEAKLRFGARRARTVQLSVCAR